MSTNESLIPAPVLDGRNEDQIAAQAIALVLQLCPELSGANASSPHTVIIEALAYVQGQQVRVVDRVPERDLIAFARIFGITLRVATPATTTLRFTVAPPPETEVRIPPDTEVATEDGAYVFRTDEQLIIDDGQTIGEVTATRTVAGPTVLAANVVRRLVDQVAFVASVTNPSPIDSGTIGETVASALERMRRYQQRGERLVTTSDIEDAVLNEVMAGAAIVKAFPFVVDGDFEAELKEGHTTVVMMTPTGLPVSAVQRAAAIALMKQLIGNQWAYVSDPVFVAFDVVVDVILQTGVAAQQITTQIETNLRAYYAASEQNFGRTIARTEIAFVIEGTPGVDRVASDATGPVFSSPTTDIALRAWELPMLDQVTINVV